ncbi:MAG: metallophosphoesterase family protein [Gemmatimonadota bacterium]|nr:MAG: metallophosphoesterase family protein [Gemmatimonadota bacterium]
MRYGIISDIHGNREALDVAVRYLESVGVDTFICVGDIVGYGADPTQCLDTVKGLTDAVVAGNHDHAAVGRSDIENFNQHAKMAVLWTSEQLSGENKDYLGSLPMMLQLDDALIVHSTPFQPEKWYYLLTHFQFVAAFQQFTERICFIGHSHQPVVFEKGKQHTGPLQGATFSLSDGSRYIINVGSVGQPRDNDPRLSCCIYDSSAMTVELIRLEYDVTLAQDKIRKAGLPEYLAQRLAHGE